MAWLAGGRARACCMSRARTSQSERPTSAGLYCAATIQEDAPSAQPLSGLPAAACSDSRSRPCRRQSRVGVTTTAARHTLPCTCAGAISEGPCRHKAP